MSRKYKSRWKISKEEATEVLEDEVRDKEFWAVDEVYNNYDKLQEVLDVLFNTIDGNRYKVAYQENQNGTRLQIQCLICAKDLTSYDPFITHENGKNHKKIRQQQLVPKDPNLSRKLEMRHHNEPRCVFPEDSLEDMIDSTKLLALGLQFVYKEVVEGRDTYSCQLCRLDRISSDRMFSHLTNMVYVSHNSKYLEVKYGVINKSRAELEDYGRIVEEREGKIHSPIIDFTKQLRLPLNSDRPKCQTPQPRSESHSRSRRSPSPASSESSRSTSPWEYRPTLSTIPPLLIPLPPPPPPLPPAQPLAMEAGITADMSEFPRPIMKEIGVMQELECREMVQEDTDMQGLLIQTLWVLSHKMSKYYQRTRAVYQNNSSSLEASAKKVQEYITRLDIVKEEDGS